MQLNLFTWQTEMLEFCWKQIALLNFDKAKTYIAEILKQDDSDNEAINTSIIIDYWQKVVIKYKAIENKNAILFLLNEIRKYEFSNSWGQQLLKTSLIKELITNCKNNSIFYLENNFSIADLFLQINNIKTAEIEILEHLKLNNENSNILSKLANIQWKLNKFSQARQNYVKAFIINYNEIVIDEIENKNLKKIIEKHGIETSVAWFWIYGENTSLKFTVEYAISQNITNSRAFTICELLYRAEILKNENNPKETVKVRKQIKDIEPELYDAYFEYLLSNNFLKVN